jgi:hypothetical protein
MRVSWGYWRPWDQARAIANARSASAELSRSRAEREEVDVFLARHLERRLSG